MAGVRLHHPTFRRVTLVVELPTVYPRPYACPRCKKLHERKSIHLQLDGDGNVIVARPIYEKLQVVHLAGLQVVNDVPKPPDMAVGAVVMLDYQVVEMHLNGQKDQSFYLPGRNQYESRDAMTKPFQPVFDKKMEEVDRKETAKKARKRSIHIFGRRGK